MRPAKNAGTLNRSMNDVIASCRDFIYEFFLMKYQIKRLAKKRKYWIGDISKAQYKTVLSPMR